MVISLSRRTLLSMTAALFAAPATSIARTERRDPLLEGFATPPGDARPRAWWHWMNGNITREGIAKDLSWMQRVGIGGVQSFDAALATPQVVSKRLRYMTPKWKEAFGFAVRRARDLDLEFAIAASPGWSETGGPWVEPRDGMKKLVWSETEIDGGTPFSAVLAHPPTATGPFQALSTQGTFGLMGAKAPPREYYGDAAVLAFPIEENQSALSPARAEANGANVDPALLNSDPSTGIAFPEGDTEVPGYVHLEFARTVTVRSATIAGVYVNDRPFAGPLAVTLESSSDGRVWRTIAQTDLGQTPSTLSFEPVRADYFRARFERAGDPDPSALGIAPGVDARELINSFARGMVTPPARLVQFEVFSSPRINEFEKKAGFAIVSDYFALDRSVGEESVRGVAAGDVVDLTGRMAKDGRLEWSPPPGRWRVVRFGYSLTGKRNHPAPPEATGLEVDKYDASAVEAYLNTYLDMYARGAAPIGSRGVRALVTDSTEVGAANWTPRMLEHFQRLRGYDAKPWMPALTGVVVGSRAESDAFLFDFRTTLGELHATEHYRTIARVAHKRGMIVYGESLEGSRSAFGDDLDLRAYADIPMSAMWSYRTAPRPGYVADGRGAASVAHIKGRKFVACESLTSMGQPWNHAPRDLQPMIDAIFLTGVNRPVIHTSVHQPIDRAPGISLSIFGQYFTRLDTWAEMAKPWVDYISRNSYLLQQGRHAADVAYFYGEDNPIGSQASGGYPSDVPRRYGYDFISASLLNELSVREGEFVSSGGARYKLIYLNQQGARMTLRVLRKLAAFVEAGGVVVGEPPLSSPSLADDEDDFNELVARMWRGRRVTRLGRGKVFAGRDVEGVLQQLGAVPDFNCDRVDDGDLQFVHRVLPDGDIYFVSNRTSRRVTCEAQFRVGGKAAQFWRADSGVVEPASYRIDGSRTHVPLELAAYESVCVVFREPASAPTRSITATEFSQVGGVSGAWTVAFQTGRGAPASITLPELVSLSEHPRRGVRYFSGVAHYSTTFDLRKRQTGRPLLLDLGTVGDVAEVRINGRFVGTAWKATSRLDIAPFVRVGRNRLEIRVANLWTNRLIGDSQPGAVRVGFTTSPTFGACAPLRPSGLIGPVTLWSTNS